MQLQGFSICTTGIVLEFPKYDLDIKMCTEGAPELLMNTRFMIDIYFFGIC